MTKITESTRIAESPDALWKTIGPFGSVGRWHPMLASVDAEGDSQGGLRTAEGRDGSRQKERLLERGRHFYRYRMEETALPVRDYTAELRVDDNHDGTSTVIWCAEFEPIADEDKATGQVSSFLKAGLDNISAMRG